MDDLKRIEAKLDALLLHLGAGKGGPRPTAESTGAAAVADDADLDGQWGNPEIRKDPKNWQGPSYAGQRMSDCPPDYLRAVAGLFDWMAKKDDEAGAKGEVDSKGRPKTGDWKRKDAARARGWAKRNANKPVAAPKGAGDAWEGVDDDIAF